ncbi:MAG TPA: aminopeptidase P family protein [Clostridiales bacterium UBA8153]|nr:aminopeptidase P family protein [Clostridiales bacterium UBA8153]
MAFLPRSVFERRLETIRSYLEANDLAALVVLTADNFYYVTNFFLDVAPWERPVAAVLPAQGQPFLVMNELSRHHLRMAEELGMLWITDWDFYVEHPRQVSRKYNVLQWHRLLADRLRARGIIKGKLGVEGPAATIARVQDHLPKLTLEDATDLLKVMRRVKCEEELAFLRSAASLTDWGMERFREIARPGRTITEVDAEQHLLMVGEAARRWPQDRVRSRVFSLTGPDSAAPHGAPGDIGRQIQKGDVIVNITIVTFNGMVCENERTFVVGPPASDLVRRAFTAAVAAQEAAIAQLVTGNVVANCDGAAQKVFEDAGFGDHILHRTGHGMGIAGHEFPEDMAFCIRPLETNEVYSAEPGIYIYGVGGFRHDDTVIVKPGRPEVVTTSPKSLRDQTLAV